MSKRLLSEFRRSEAGNFALIIALCAVPLFGGIALTTDYVALNQQRSSLQEAVDGSALAVAKEMALANSKTLDVQSLAENYVRSQFDVPSRNSLVIKAEKKTDGSEIDVTASYVWEPFFIQYLNAKALPIVVTSKAGFAGTKSSICVLALDTSSDFALSVGSKSSVTANGCSIFSNSSSSKGINSDPNASMGAVSIQTAGGYAGSDQSYKPVPITDAPVVADPLASRAEPTVGICDYKNYSLSSNTTETLQPGVYCGGLNVGGKAIAKLEPGIYIIKDGPLSVGGNASLIGDHVGFYFTGANATFDFGVSTQAVLSAPKTGEMAGILFFEQRDAAVGRNFTIRSKDAEKFEGTIYLPKGRIFIDKASRVGQQSKWTAFVVNKFEVGKGPQLEINSDYANSDVPVPEGITGETQVRLLK